MALPQVLPVEIGLPPVTYDGNPYLGAQETALLIALVRSVAAKVMIEFGCQLGRTALSILENVPSIERYVGVDVPPGSRPTLQCQRSEVCGAPGLYARSDPRFNLVLRARGSLDLVPEDLPWCDAVFVDGDHRAIAVKHDSLLARALVRPGGVIAWHDYGNSGVEVTAALDELAAAGWPIRSIAGTWLAFMMV